MKRLTSLLLLILGIFFCHAQKSQTWCSDNGDGIYTNPVLYADYSDPDVCAVGEDYYLTASSFNCIPGLPILHSKDLVNWEIVGHALQELEPKEVFDKPAHGKGVWAPSIRYHNDSLYIYWGDPDYGIFMVKAKDPCSPWSKPLCVIQGKGMIDPCPLWDNDGRCYLVNGWANSRAGFNSVLTMRELSADGTQAIGLPRIVFDGGQENYTTEGPKLYKRDGWYWILCPAGGVEMGWQLAMRSKSPYGPYECRKVMWQGTTDINGPHQGGWVHTPHGEDWFLHFNDKGAYGRVVYLQPVDWSSGWPIMGNHGEPYTRYKKPRTNNKQQIANPLESDEFNDGSLGLQWQWHANYHQFYGQPTANGTYRLYTMDEPEDYKSLWDVPNLLLQKSTAPCFTATAKVRFAAKEDGQYGGMVMMGRDYSSLVVCRQGDSFLLQRRTCMGADEGQEDTSETLTTLQPTDCDTIPYSPANYLDLYLRMTVKDGLCDYSYSLDGRHFNPAGASFNMREGKWIGAKFGFVAECRDCKASRGWLDIDWIRVTKTDVNPQFTIAMTAWTLPSDYTLDEAKTFLQSIYNDGYNTVQMSAVFGEIDHDICKKAFRNDDILKPNEKYWQKVDSTVKMATDLGLRVIINPIWKRSLNDFIARQGVEKCRAYGQWFARRYKDNPLISYFIGGDQIPEPVREHMDAMGQGIQDVYDGRAVIAYHSEGSQSSCEAFPDASWLTLNWTYAYTPAYKFEGQPRYPYQMNYENLSHFPTMPIQFGEGYYDFGSAKRYNAEGISGRWGNRYVLRRQAWWNATSGATGVAYGAEGIWHKNRDGQTWQQCLNYESSRDMAYMKQLLDSLHWWELHPDTAHIFLVDGYGTYLTDDYATAAVSPDGLQAIIYTPVQHRLVLSTSINPRQLTFRWYDSTNGTFKSIDHSQLSIVNSQLVIDSPAENASGTADMVLVITSIFE